MSRRSVSILMRILILTMPLLLAWGCGSEQTSEEAADTTTVAVDSTEFAYVEPDTTAETWVSEPAPDSPEELRRKMRQVHDWYPMHKRRLDWALEDVDKISFFPDLGLGDEIQVALTARGGGGFPVGHAVRMKLAGKKTALVIRFLVDTLPGPRVQGEGVLGLLALHCSETLGRDLLFDREQSGTGRLDLEIYRDNIVSLDLACCGIPPAFTVDSFGDPGDTLTVMMVFEKRRQKYVVHILGPSLMKSIPGMGYKTFRTERGEFHKDMTEYPYMCTDNDPDYIGLFVGSQWRGRKSVREPVIRARIF